MKRRLFVCFLALTMLLSLTACGASSKTAASVDSSANDHPAESPAVTEEKGYFDADTNGYDDEGRDSGGGVLENQKIIYTGDINLETTEFDEAVKALASLAEAGATGGRIIPSGCPPLSFRAFWIRPGSLPM